MNRKRRRSAAKGLRLAMVAGLSLWAMRRLRAQLSYQLQGRTVLVTGGSRGLGLALARRFAGEGARVAICGSDADSLERARASLEAAGAEVMAVPCDVTDPASVQAMLEAVRQRYGSVDVLVNNAGVIEIGPVVTMSVPDYQQAMTTNFWGMLHPTLGVLPDMRARRSGRIVNITSIGGQLGVPHLLPYSTSKFAAVGFSQGLRAEVAPDGIKVVTVRPGLMRTGSSRNAIFRGQHRSEYAWFSISDALPGLSISAERAARRIVAACRRGDSEVLFPVPARIAAVMNSVAPGLTASIVAAAARLLPGPDGSGPGRRTTGESQSRLLPSWLSKLGDRAVRKFNEIAAGQGENVNQLTGPWPE